MSSEEQTLRLLRELERIDEEAARSEVSTSQTQPGHVRGESGAKRTAGSDGAEVGVGATQGLNAARLFENLMAHDFDLDAAIVSAARGA